MYCSKCGNVITEKDKLCPKCNAININYQEDETNDLITESDVQSKKGNKKCIKYVGICVILVFVGVALFLGNMFLKDINKPANGVKFTHRGFTAKVDGNNKGYFLMNNKVTEIKEPVKSGIISPDNSKFVVLLDNGNLCYGAKKELQDILISENVSEIEYVTNNGCFFVYNNKHELYYYDFKKNESIYVGFESAEYRYSSLGHVVAGLNYKGELYQFNTKDASIINVSNTTHETNICCIADDGSNIVWSQKNGNEHSVYMLINGIPERIGKIKSNSDYGSCYGKFYNNSKSFYVYLYSSSQIILCNNGEIIDVNLPGIVSYFPGMNNYGKFIDSDDDNIDPFYIALAESDYSDIGYVYRLSSSGELTKEADDVDIYNIVIREGHLYYLNRDSDLVEKTLGEKTTRIISTEVSDYYVSPYNKYVYIVKSGNLYYWDISNKEYKLNKINTSSISDIELYTTDKDDTIFFIDDLQSIPDTYRSKGTLYTYTIGKNPIKIEEDIMFLRYTDKELFSASSPTIVKYISNKRKDYSSGFVVDFGTISDGKYITLISNVEL